MLPTIVHEQPLQIEDARLGELEFRNKFFVGKFRRGHGHAIMMYNTFILMRHTGIN